MGAVMGAAGAVAADADAGACATAEAQAGAEAAVSLPPARDPRRAVLECECVIIVAIVVIEDCVFFIMLYQRASRGSVIAKTSYRGRIRRILHLSRLCEWCYLAISNKNETLLTFQSLG